MEKFVLLILCSGLYSIRENFGQSQVLEEPLPLGCTENLPPCSDVHDIATITCGAVGAECIIKCGAELGVCDETDAGIIGEDGNKIKTIDAGICKEMCRQQATLAADPVNACHFYRWEKEDQGKCILQTNCGEPDMTCQPFDEPRCMTGQIGCTEDGATSCSLEKAVEYNPDKFHLICRGDSHSPGNINIYSPAHIAEIPTGTVCYTIHMCADWNALDGGDPMTPPTPLPTYYRKLAVKCSVDGIFEVMDSGTGDDVLSGGMVQGGILEEPECSTVCETMEMIEANIHAKGTELICDETLKGPLVNKLENGNSCVLICDNHFAMSISCELEHEGTKAWMNENRGVLTTEDVKC